MRADPSRRRPASLGLEVALSRPGADALEELREYLSRNGREWLAAKLAEGEPAFPQHVTVFDLDAAAALGSNAPARLAVRATFGPSDARGPEVGAQAWRDAHGFLRQEDQRDTLAAALTLLEQMRDAAGPIIEHGRASLGASAADALDGPPRFAALPPPRAALPAPTEEAPDAL